MDHKVVIFGQGTVKIIHTEDITAYQDRVDCLIDPVFPRGIPPHQWRLKDGMISTDLTLPFPIQPAVSLKPVKSYKTLTIIMTIVSIVLLSALSFLILHH